jgi:type IV pilus assembly protein PilQ
VAPPVGDIAIAEGQIIGNTIDLGSNERIPKLLLRDAPAREVLSLLARAAGLNLIFTPGDGAAGGQEQAGGAGDGPPVSLDIENESVQDVFNHVLRVTGLQANRVGRSIYVGPRLPDSARNIASRTLRLNQVAAIEAAGFLASLGAEATQTVNRDVTTVTTLGGGVEGADAIQQVTTTNETSIEALTYSPDGDQSSVARPLNGLQVIADNRLNSLTLVGESRLVSLGSEYLTRLDLRRRQVAINVRVIDINLSALDAFGTSFSFASGNFGAVQSGGVGVVNLGAAAPPSAGGVPAGTPIPPRSQGIATTEPLERTEPGPFGGTPFGFINDFVQTGSAPFAIFNSFLAQLTATIQSGNGKIITDPTLIVQEGQQASVALTTQIVQRITTEFTDTPSGTRETRTPELADSGLVLTINVNSIDDNGFVTFTVAPSISAPVSQFETGSGIVTLLSQRELQSGQIRVRDGQTLLLSGIIQESERSSVTKIPILGDIPILGALFRSTVTDNQRQELIVLLTPQILDDSDQSVFGYSYIPSEEVQEILENRGQ